MSRETLATLNTRTLIGFTGQRGHAWHYRAGHQGTEPNHYPGAIPVGDVLRRLFDWEAISRRIAVEVPASLDDPLALMDHLDPDGLPARWAVQEDRQAIVRSDNHHTMGLFKDGYVPHQYQQWLLEAVSAILGDTLAISSAGLLREGAVAWVEVSVPETVHLDGPGVSFRPNLLGTTSFDGSIATCFKRTITVTVCDNTLAVALSEAGQLYRIKHSRWSGFKLSEARAALNVIETTTDEFSAQVEALCQTTVTDRQWEQFLAAHAPLTDDDGRRLTGRSLTAATRKQDELRSLWTGDQRVSPWKGTAWGVLQATNTWSHHLQTVRGATRADRNALNTITGAQAREDNDTLTTLGRILTPA
jgi:phage/plasmid-like protein (TIGR03299 family)